MLIKSTVDGIELLEVFSGVLMTTEEGNQIGVCMRDDTFEINVIPKGATERNWWRVNMQTGRITNAKEDCEKYHRQLRETADNAKLDGSGAVALDGGA